MNQFIQYGADIALIGLLILEIVIAAKMGFVRIILTVLAALIAFSVAITASKPLASRCYDVFLNPKVCEAIEENAAGLNAAQTVDEVVTEVAKVLPDSLNEFFNESDVDYDDVSNRIGADGGKEKLSPQQISDSIVKPVAVVPLRVITMVLCYLILTVIFRIIIRKFGKFERMKALKKANHALGAVVGAARGLILVYVLSMLCVLISRITTSQEVRMIIEQSSVITFCQNLQF